MRSEPKIELIEATEEDLRDCKFRCYEHKDGTKFKVGFVKSKGICISNGAFTKIATWASLIAWAKVHGKPIDAKEIAEIYDSVIVNKHGRSAAPTDELERQLSFGDLI